eukprot:439594-Rhodomonas_salina.1
MVQKQRYMKVTYPGKSNRKTSKMCRNLRYLLNEFTKLELLQSHQSFELSSPTEDNSGFEQGTT